MKIKIYEYVYLNSLDEKTCKLRYTYISRYNYYLEPFENVTILFDFIDYVAENIFILNMYQYVHM